MVIAAAGRNAGALWRRECQHRRATRRRRAPGGPIPALRKKKKDAVRSHSRHKYRGFAQRPCSGRHVCELSRRAREVLLHALEERACMFSTGSACSSKSKVSAVLTAMAMEPDRAESAALACRLTRPWTSAYALRPWELYPVLRRLREIGMRKVLLVRFGEVYLKGSAALFLKRLRITSAAVGPSADTCG